MPWWRSLAVRRASTTPAGNSLARLRGPMGLSKRRRGQSERGSSNNGVMMWVSKRGGGGGRPPGRAVGVVELGQDLLLAEVFGAAVVLEGEGEGGDSFVEEAD